MMASFIILIMTSSMVMKYDGRPGGNPGCARLPGHERRSRCCLGTHKTSALHDHHHINDDKEE